MSLHTGHIDATLPPGGPTGTTSATGAMPHTTPGRAGTGAAPTPRRWNPARGRWNGWLHLLAFPLALALFIVTAVGLGTLVLTAGLLLLAVSLPATRWLADVHRRDAGALLGEDIPSPYRQPTAPTAVGRLLQRLRDPQTWRDQAWLLVSSTVGFALSLLSVVLFLCIPWYLLQPLLLALVDEAMDTDFGIYYASSVLDGFALWSIAAIAAALWWWGSPWLMRLHAVLDRALLGPTESERVRMLRERVDTLSETRAETVDAQAAELRRLERDLHDGAQARLVSSNLTIGLAIEAIDQDPGSARAMLEEAQEANRAALNDLRNVVRGIHPPVLSDRGLVGAVQALAVQMPTPVSVLSELPGRPPAPIESAAYFAVAECLTNLAKHARATRATVELSHEARPSGTGVLRIVVTDDGQGGAHMDPAGGLAGIERRLAVFDGTIQVDSPTGGPTRLTLEIPTELGAP